MAQIVIKDGDTLTKISEETGVPVVDIAKANGITNINRIYAGDIITIPDGNSTTSSPSTTPTITPWTDNNYDPTKSTSVSSALKNKETADAAVATHIKTGFQTSANYDKANQNKVDADNAVKNYGDFSYSKQSDLDAIMNNILNRKDFSYDLNGDALYQQYKDKYIQQGKMAMQDTMGQASAMTGGYGNSYASTAGNQAYQASLQNLNDIVPELYQMAYDRYQQEGQDMYNQYAMLTDDKNTQYGMWSDEYNRLVADRDYYSNEENNLYNREYGEWMDKTNILANDRTYYDSVYNNEKNFDFGVWSDDRNFDYGVHRDDVADQQWQAQFDEAKRQYNEQMAMNREQWEYQKAQASKAQASGGSGGSGSGGGGGSDTLYYYAYTDDYGNAVYHVDGDSNKEYKVQAGLNPYTRTKHPDAANGTFSNGYQPDNINGTKLKNSGQSTNVTGKNQTIWECNGKYYLWIGNQNKYVEVDIED
jgi:hypothetical protein